MKRVLLMGMMALVVAAGVIAGRARMQPAVRTSMAAATITSRMTEYGTDGSVMGTWALVRRQYSDGSWKNHIDDVNGKPFDSSGRVDPAKLLSADAYAREADARGRRRDQWLGYMVYIQKDAGGTEGWYCPELDAMLKEVHYDKDGKLETIIEATEIIVGEPD